MAKKKNAKISLVERLGLTLLTNEVPENGVVLTCIKRQEGILIQGYRDSKVIEQFKISLIDLLYACDAESLICISKYSLYRFLEIYKFSTEFVYISDALLKRLKGNITSIPTYKDYYSNGFAIQFQNRDYYEYLVGHAE